MDEQPSKKANGIGTALLHYMQSNRGRDVTIDELMASMPQWDRRQLFSNMGNLKASEVGKTITSPKTGVWRLDYEKTSTDITLELLKYISPDMYIAWDPVQEAVFTVKKVK